jgi:hypothetical protein
MKTQISQLQDLCAKNPALRNLLQFNPDQGKEVAELKSGRIEFKILYNESEGNFLMNYRHTGSWVDEDCDGYVRCSDFEEVLEALSEEMSGMHDSRIHRENYVSPVSDRWLNLLPVWILPSFRATFSLALEKAASYARSGKQHHDNISRWAGYMNQLALSA